MAKIKASHLAEIIANLSEEAQSSVVDMVNLLADKHNSVESAGEPKLPGRKPRALKEDVEEDAKTVKNTAKKNTAKGKNTAKVTKSTTKPAAGVKSSFEDMDADDFCEKYGVNAKKNKMAAAKAEILTLLNDRKDFEYYMKKAAKARIDVKLYRGKPSDMTRKLAAIVALHNAG